MDRRPGEPGPDLTALRRALASNDLSARAAAVLDAPNLPGVEELILSALADPAPEVRRAAVQALARIGGPRGVRALMDAARSDLSPFVRAEAVAVLGRILRSRTEGSGGGSAS
jgi:HEAT repeat protein